jgi:tol-pal system protein YbgF
MATRRTGRLPVLAASLLLGGCATQGGVSKVNRDVWRAQEQLEGLSGQVGALDSTLAAQADSTYRRWALLSTDGEALKLQMSQMQARLTDVSRRLADIAQTLEQMRLYGGSSGAGRPSPAAPVAGPADSLRRAEPSPGVDATELYNLAFRDLEAKNYRLATSEFAQFLESFPGSDLADNAGYWLGECYAAQKEYKNAVAAFQQVLDKYPEGDKVPAAMLKLGFVLPQVKQGAKAERVLRDLVSKYPESEEATKARQRLRSMAKKP